MVFDGQRAFKTELQLSLASQYGQNGVIFAQNILEESEARGTAYRFYGSNSHLRDYFEITVDRSNGALVWARDKRVVNLTSAKFVMTQDGRIFAADQASMSEKMPTGYLDRYKNAQDPLKHSMFAPKEPVVAAGGLSVVDGKLTGVSNYSGHYSFGTESNTFAISRFQDLGLVSNRVKVIDFSQGSSLSFEDFDGTSQEAKVEAIKNSEISIEEARLNNFYTIGEELSKIHEQIKSFGAFVDGLEDIDLSARPQYPKAKTNEASKNVEKALEEVRTYLIAFEGSFGEVHEVFNVFLNSIKFKKSSNDRVVAYLGTQELSDNFVQQVMKEKSRMGDLIVNYLIIKDRFDFLIRNGSFALSVDPIRQERAINKMGIGVKLLSNRSRSIRNIQVPNFRRAITSF